MILLPIISRELRVLARRKKTFFSRLAASCIAALTMVWLLLIGAGQPNLAGQGALLFETLAVIGFVFAALAGPVVTADALSEERREGTLGFLFLTPLKGWDVVLGKMATFSLNAVYALIAMLPMLSFGFLLGGIAPAQVGQVALVLLNTLFLSLSAGLFVSTFCVNERRAMVASVLLVAGLIGAPFLFVNFEVGWSVFLKEHVHFLQFSPIFGLLLVSQPAAWPLLRGDFFASLFQIHLLSWGLLGLASLFLPSRAKESAEHPLWLRIKTRAEEWQYGSLDKRKKLRATLLDENPFLWLGGRHRLKKAYAWGAMALILIIWLASGRRYPDLALPIGVFFLFMIHLLLKLWLTSEVCSRMVEQRRSGAWELLLPCPITVREIAQGHLRALRRQFIKPIVFLIVLEILVYTAGAQFFLAEGRTASRAIVFAGLIMLPVDLWALAWTGLWVSMRKTSVNKAFLAAIFRILILPTLILLAFQVTWTWSQVSFQLNLGHLNELLFPSLWVLLSLTIDLMFGSAARRNFLDLFRLMAERRFDSPLGVAKLRSKIRHDPAEIYLRKQRRQWLMRAAVVALALGSLFGAYRWNLHSQLQQQLKRVQEAGYPIDWDQFARWHSPAPAMQSPLEAELSRIRVAGGRGSRRANEKDDDFFAQNARLLELIHAGVSLRNNSPPIDYLVPYQTLWMSVSMKGQRVHMLENLLMRDATSRMNSGDWATAIRDLEALFELADSLRNEPHPWMQQARFACLRQAVTLLQLLLGRHKLDPVDLTRLKAKFEAAANGLDLVPAFACERFHFIQMLKQGPLITQFMFGGPPRGNQALMMNLVAGFGRIAGQQNRELIVLLDYSEQLIEVAGLPFPDRWDHSKTLSSGKAPTKIPFWLQNGQSVLQEQIRTIASLRGAQFALNIELYHESGGRYTSATPEAQEQLSVQDPYTGGPLLVRKEGQNLVLYVSTGTGMDVMFTLPDKDAMTGSPSKPTVDQEH